MMGRTLDFLLAEVLLLLLLPFLVLGFLLKKLLSIRPSALRLPQPGAVTGRKAAVPARARELVFARAIEAYEELIDTTHLAAHRAG